MSERIHLSRAQSTELEERYVLEALRSGWIAPLGPMVERFEAEIAARVGVGHALALSSGTAALHLALLGVGAGTGRVVVAPSMTFAATVNAVAYTGAELVLVDSRPDDANLDVDLTLEAVRTLQQEGADVACVVSVDLYGRACDYSRLMPGLAELGVPLVEDAAEALGASHRGRAAGSFGVAGILSFNGNKIMTTSGGGMLVSDDADFVARARFLSTQSREPVSWYEHREVGYNYRLSNILAAIGVAQLARLDDMIGRRRDIRDLYRAGLGDLPGIRFLDGTAEEDNMWLTSVILPEGAPSPTELVEHLETENVEVRHLWKPMHLQPMYSATRFFGPRDVAGSLFERGLNLPSGAELSDAQVQRVIALVRQALDA